MALKTTIDNTTKLGSVVVTQTNIVGDASNNDVTNVGSSGATGIVAMQIVNGSQIGFYVKLQDTAAGSTNIYPKTCIYVASGSTQFVGFGTPLVFDTAISVVVSTTSGTGNGAAITGTSSWTIIATDSAKY